MFAGNALNPRKNAGGHGFPLNAGVPDLGGAGPALTDGGTSGGLMCAAKKHINFRLHSSFTVEGKGCQILIGRFAGRDVAIGNIYLQSGTGPTSPLNSKILGWLADSWKPCHVLG